MFSQHSAHRMYQALDLNAQTIPKQYDYKISIVILESYCKIIQHYIVATKLHELPSAIFIMFSDHIKKIKSSARHN